MVASERREGLYSVSCRGKWAGGGTEEVSPCTSVRTSLCEPRGKGLEVDFRDIKAEGPHHFCFLSHSSREVAFSGSSLFSCKVPLILGSSAVVIVWNCVPASSSFFLSTGTSSIC